MSNANALLADAPLNAFWKRSHIKEPSEQLDRAMLIVEQALHDVICLADDPALVLKLLRQLRAQGLALMHRAC